MSSPLASSQDFIHDEENHHYDDKNNRVIRSENTEHCQQSMLLLLSTQKNLRERDRYRETFENQEYSVMLNATEDEEDDDMLGRGRDSRQDHGHGDYSFASPVGSESTAEDDQIALEDITVSDDDDYPDMNSDGDGEERDEDDLEGEGGDCHCSLFNWMMIL